MHVLSVSHSLNIWKLFYQQQISEASLPRLSEKNLKSLTQSCPTLCNPVDCSPPGSSVHGILQARILEWVAIWFSKGSSWAKDWTWVSCVAGGFFTIWAITLPEGVIIPSAIQPRMESGCRNPQLSVHFISELWYHSYDSVLGWVF